MDNRDVRIDVIDTVQGCREHERLQGLVWGYEGGGGTVPAEFLLATARNGGVVLGAYAGGIMAGLLLGVPAIRAGRQAHHSHLLGVHPAWRGRGIGEALKWRQRELVLAQGIGAITWTFDPLEAANARLNIAHLGGLVSEYTRDYYGPMADALNRAVPSDRFTLQWSLRSLRVRDRAAGRRRDEPLDAPLALGSTLAADGLPRPTAFAEPSGPAALVEIPARVQDVKRRALDAALAWRLAVRAACETLFARGYVATGVVRRDDRVFYYLEQTS